MKTFAQHSKEQFTLKVKYDGTFEIKIMIKAFVAYDEKKFDSDA